jgi:DNA-binding PadR family transcriptional regulator
MDSELGKPKKVPKLTFSQFLVLGLLLDGDCPGRKIRDELLKHGERKSGPAFYQAMARLEDAGFVKGRYQQITAGDQLVKERWYTITRDGIHTWNEAASFSLAVCKGRLNLPFARGASIARVRFLFGS